ncbi:MAG: TrmH family RNA methyltransferase [Bdellovibrionales bacterium]
MAVSKKRMKQMERDFMKEKALNTLAKPGVHELIIVLDSLKPDFNVGKIFRSSDAFGVKEINLIGIPFFSPATAMGSFRHVPAKFFESFKPCYDYLKSEGYDIYIFEPTGGSQLGVASFPKKSALIMGHEEFGISFNKADYPDLKVITVPQFGKVQSLNVSIAASVAMYEYVRQQHFSQTEQAPS